MACIAVAMSVTLLPIVCVLRMVLWRRVNRRRGAMKDSFMIGECFVCYNGRCLITQDDLSRFSKNHGFEDAKQMFDWFREKHGLPFVNIVEESEEP